MFESGYCIIVLIVCAVFLISAVYEVRKANKQLDHMIEVLTEQEEWLKKFNKKLEKELEELNIRTR
ncbi:hypothetical protein KAU51_02280 [Candidatus Parcubacteria bacterium]|nr:hypothetical protein [Candidatus Parcubacteria bacterium]